MHKIDWSKKHTLTYFFDIIISKNIIQSEIITRKITQLYFYIIFTVYINSILIYINETNLFFIFSFAFI